MIRQIVGKSSRSGALAEIESYFSSGSFAQDLACLVRIRSESQNPELFDELERYLRQSITPLLDEMDFNVEIATTIHGCPILVAERIEDEQLTTVLIYAHGDVCDPQENGWREDLYPYELVVEGDRIYGRGTADNKAQHLINLKALSAIVRNRGRIGFNVKFVMEMAEEIGSPGLNEFFRDNASRLKADVLIASDGPRLRATRPTLFLGSRAALNFELKVDLREGAYHSGNFGGLIADPAIVLLHAISTIVDQRGQILITEWRPTSLTEDFRATIADLPLGEDGPEIDMDWGEVGLTPAERAFGWNSFSVLSMLAGTPASPQNAISGSASATCQLRYVIGTDHKQIIPALRRHLDARDLHQVEIIVAQEAATPATRFPANHPWVRFVTASIADTSGQQPDILPNLAGTIPNDVFTEELDLPTIWVPHSYGGCCQHAPNEHVLGAVALDALRNMTGLFWDIGEIEEKIM